MVHRIVLAGLCLWAALTGCSAKYYENQADRSGDGIVDEKTAEVDRFRENDLIDPRDDLKPREPFVPPTEIPETVTLDDAIRISTRYNRDYQSRRENFFILALGLDLTRRDFLQMVFSGSVNYSGSDGRALDFTDSLTLTLSGTQRLYTGGRVTVTGAANQSSLAIAPSDIDHNSSVRGTVSITQPLLRGAGHAIAFEPLTQAERNLVYEARRFEVFRQSFAIDRIAEYYDLVRQKLEMVNTRRQLKNLEFALSQARALYRVNLGSQVDVTRAEESLLAARNTLLDQEQGYDLSLDRFKVQLGVPVDSRFDVGNELPTPGEFDVDMEKAVVAALHNRLDLRTQRDIVEDVERRLEVAENNLLPDFNASASYTVFSGNSDSFRELFFDDQSVIFGLDLEIPLDRRAERNNYRSAQIFVRRARRDLRQAEDDLILEIRNALRALRTELAQVNIGNETIKANERKVKQARIENIQGLADNRDIVEAVDELTVSKNEQLARYVRYEIARLRFIQRVGLMFVNEDGQIATEQDRKTS